MFNDVHAGPERPDLRMGYHPASAPNGRTHVHYPGGMGGLLTSRQGDNIGLESGLWVIISQTFPMRRTPGACGNCRALHLP